MKGRQSPNGVAHLALATGLLFAAVPGAAQTQAGSSGVTGEAATAEEITVTASRIQGGFAAPTPTTVIGTEQIQAAAPVNVADALSQIPSFRSAGATSSAVSYANLRSIGADRTLVLVDGRRHVATTSQGAFDLNLIPTSLIARTEVVTGGASASWGSDAVAGVINLILRTDLEGIEISAQSGISKYGDAANNVVSLAAGTHFAEDLGRVLFGAEYASDHGVGDLQTPSLSRPWAGRDRVSNSRFATNGQPGVIYAADVRRADTSADGLITNGPLGGQVFNANGTLRPFGYGQVYGNNMIGGTDNFGETTTPGGYIRFPFERYSAFTHVEFDFGTTTAFAEGSFAHSLGRGYTNALRFQGSVTANTTSCNGTTAPTSLGGIFVNINNPFLDSSVRTAMTNAGVTCIEVGRTFRDIGNLQPNDGTDKVWRGVLGLRGRLGDSWKWDAYFQYGKSASQEMRIGNLNMENFRKAIDAVNIGTDAAPVIVCRSTITNPGDGCVPLNIFGSGSVTPEMREYVTGDAVMNTDITQKVAAVNLSGEPIRLWAGPLGVAVGAEWRQEKIDIVVDPRSNATGWQTGNRRPSAGTISVREVYGEINLPILNDFVIAKSLDMNGAIRYTDYSSSGGVTTWKVGATWEITDGLRLRGTRSRDIRAGNLGELFTPASTATASGLRNPITGDSSPALVITTGNRTLAPEKANTWTAGISYSPRWFSGFRASVDWYKIGIKGAIGTLTAQQIIDRCYLDSLDDFCSLITTDAAGRITTITTSQLNLNRYDTDGVDIEISYNTPLSRWSEALPGNLGLRVLANYVHKLATTAAVDARVTDPAGQYTQPHWTVLGTVNYSVGHFSTLFDLRWYAGGAIDNTLTEGALSATGVNINHVGSSFYANMALTYRLDTAKRRELFFRVNNLFNGWPPFPSNGGGVFDVTGRAYRIGVRLGF